MRTLRYLTLDVITHTLAVSLVLFLVVFSGRFIKYLAEAAIGDLSAGILLPVMLYKLPAFFELILPLAFILVCCCHLAVCTRTAKWLFLERVARVRCNC